MPKGLPASLPALQRRRNLEHENYRVMARLMQSARVRIKELDERIADIEAGRKVAPHAETKRRRKKAKVGLQEINWDKIRAAAGKL